MTIDPASALETWRDGVEAALPALLDEVVGSLEAVDAQADLEPVALAARSAVLGGGKRLRPLFCLSGAVACGDAVGEPLLRAATALELLQSAALVHDDVIDGSDTRRGHVSTHRRFASLHATGGWRGNPETFGAAAAILVGDLLLSGAVTAVATSGLDAASLQRGWPVWRAMVGELTAGQYLDVREQAAGGDSVARALLVTRLKAAAYTVARPLELGAAFAGGAPDTVAGLSAYGVALGQAFQLRDDVLGVFGTPDITGKPAGDDLREGKQTALVILARSLADGSGRRVIDRCLGDPLLDDAGVEQVRDVVVTSGALDRVEQLIVDGHARALDVLAATEVSDTGRAVLTLLAGRAVDRAH